MASLKDQYFFTFFGPICFFLFVTKILEKQIIQKVIDLKL